MYTCGFCINASLVKEGNLRINAKLVEEELKVRWEVLVSFHNGSNGKNIYINLIFGWLQVHVDFCQRLSYGKPCLLSYPALRLV